MIAAHRGKYSAMQARVLVLAACLVASAAGQGRAAPADWLGADACGRCHPAALAAWQKSAHARATATLGKRPRAACLSCHASGEPGARDGGVGCEACHGAGAAYAASDDVMRDAPLARALGLRDLKADLAATCARCHRPGEGTRLQPFDAARAWTKIQH
jgi:hypothetical protein